MRFLSVEQERINTNSTVHVTAARLRFLLNVNGHSEAAARDGEGRQ